MTENDKWESGEAYESYVGRWSRAVARIFLDWLALPPGSGWLDVGCGTGALTGSILRYAEPRSVTGIDPAEGFVAYAREYIRDPRASFRVGDTVPLPFSDATFDAVVSGLVLNFIPELELAMSEMVRVARRGGLVAAYLWDYSGEMQMMRAFWDAAVEMDPAAIERDEARRFPVCKPQPLAELFRGAGLTEVEVRAIDITTDFRNFDHYWLPFLRGQGPAPGYVATLSEERRSALRDQIRFKLPIAPDGSIALIARAWAVRGNT